MTKYRSEVWFPGFESAILICVVCPPSTRSVTSDWLHLIPFFYRVPRRQGLHLVGYYAMRGMMLNVVCSSSSNSGYPAVSFLGLVDGSSEMVVLSDVC